MTDEKICRAVVRMGKRALYLSLSDDLECFADGWPVVIIPEGDYNRLVAEMKAGVVSVSVGPAPEHHTHYYDDCPQVRRGDLVHATITFGDPDFPVCPHCASRGLTLKTQMTVK